MTLINLYFHVFALLKKNTNLKERLYMTLKINPANKNAYHTRNQTRANKARLVALGFQGKI